MNKFARPAAALLTFVVFQVLWLSTLGSAQAAPVISHVVASVLR